MVAATRRGRWGRSVAAALAGACAAVLLLPVRAQEAATNVYGLSLEPTMTPDKAAHFVNMTLLTRFLADSMKSSKFVSPPDKTTGACAAQPWTLVDIPRSYALAHPAHPPTHAQCAVQFQFSMWQLVEVNTMKQTMELHGWSRHYWRDLRLVHMCTICVPVYIIRRHLQSPA